MNILVPFSANNWQSFRDHELWTQDVNNIFQANLDGIQKVYASFLRGGMKKYMTMDDAIKLFSRLTEVRLIESQASFCYGMSKMTNILERQQGAN